MNLPENREHRICPDERFIEWVRDVLAHLYDYAYLQAHPLAGELGLDEPFAQDSARFIRTMVLKTIEEMHPGTVPFRSVQARAYNVLNLHYVEGLTIQEVARELAISERQCYRDLRKAEEDLASMLWARRVAPPANRGVEEVWSASRDALVRREAERLSPQIEEVDITVLLKGALDAVSALASRREVRIELEVGANKETLVRVDRLLVRQALVNALSYAVQNALAHTSMHISALVETDAFQMRLAFKAQGDERKEACESLAAAQQLVKRVGGRWAIETLPMGETRINLTLGRHSCLCVLVIDDNAGLIELFQRYLAGEPYEVIGAKDGREGLLLASDHRPDIIVLDIMMPQQDGWEILQRLKTQERTKDIPVVVCSVLNDPELAFSLGACEFLAKPVTRDRLLTALRRCR